MHDEPPPKRRWITRKRLLRIAIGTTILFTAVILSLPFAIREGIEYALRSQGQTEANIDSLYFNPFTATLELGGLTGGVTRRDIEVLSLSKIAGEGVSEAVEGEFTPPPLVPAGLAGAVDETGEGEVSEEAVNELANERANAVKSHLVEDYGINATRLFVEPPVLDESTSAGGGPRVGISL
jgi:hypothetical protein